jgi:phosphatidylglycerol:prolipoprotein diacylglycerol transferase
VIHWKFDPVLLAIGPLTIRWYGVLFVGAFFAGKSILDRILVAEGHASGKAEKLLIYALVCTVVGARLAHCLLYDPQFYLANPLAILRIW